MDISLERFRTARLTAQRVRLADYDELCRFLHSDPLTMATLGGVRSHEVTKAFLEEKIAHWEEYGHGLWIFRKPHTQEFVGRGLLEHIEVGGGPEVEVGYVVKRALWREGYATEMAAAMISLGFHALPIDSIVSFTYPDNTGSRRVMEKCGLTYEREIQHVGRDHVLYRITRDEHRNGPLVRVVHGEYVVE